MKELQPLEADHSKLKEDFCTTAKSALGCENVVLLLRNFAALLHQSNSKDFSSEDERLGSSSLRVKKAGHDCGILALKFMEFLNRATLSTSMAEDKLHMYRLQLVVQLLLNEWNNLKDKILASY
ncbi:hypothetical protein CK203_036491 [Vitis vinifera]|uniref:Uncharacterized protein n=1 Tax=Vitis vinifera TaxID=29760 RepID=A0A438HZT4_VITVI|nr:hypothetical protein CK203_036491 [Vitis vinifera]